jgi:hypothetical protein
MGTNNLTKGNHRAREREIIFFFEKKCMINKLNSLPWNQLERLQNVKPVF